MSKSVKKRSAASSTAAGGAAKPSQQTTIDPKSKNVNPGSKQSRVAESQRLLDRSDSPEGAGRDAVNLNQRSAELRPGTVLAREWNGQMQRVAVLADGFAWNGKTYPSLSKVAFTITGTRWSGPKFFGFRGKSSKGASQ
jgi:Protein of unknown function (DUF2924)